ncbi:MAG: magnesium chelatase, partial [Candidatus Binatia bacterium]
LEHEIAIMEQEAILFPRGEFALHVPQFIKEILAQLTMEARSSSEINQTSGVSVRMTINNLESMLSNAEKRAVRLKEREIVPRISDLRALYASTAGKIELEYAGEDKREEEVIERLTNRAVLKVFDRYFTLDALKPTIVSFENRQGVEVSDEMPSSTYMEGLHGIPGLKENLHVLAVDGNPGLTASAIEFVLEGLHLHQKLNKERIGGRYTYRV